MGTELLHTFVSILSQPEGRELLRAAYDEGSQESVSILSQPEGRELPNSGSPYSFMPVFQSSPSPKAGSYW